MIPHRRIHYRADARGCAPRCLTDQLGRSPGSDPTARIRLSGRVAQRFQVADTSLVAGVGRSLSVELVRRWKLSRPPAVSARDPFRPGRRGPCVYTVGQVGTNCFVGNRRVQFVRSALNFPLLKAPSGSSRVI